MERRHDLAVPNQTAAALLHVTTLYQRAVDAEDVLNEKRRSYRLVVVTGRGRCEVYWKGQRVEADWSEQRAPWSLLLALVEQAKSGQGADAFDLEPEARGALKDRRYRLKQQLPAELDAHIQPAGRGTYQLHLPPGELCLLQFEEEERLVEAGSGSAGSPDA